jgi:hypothetical protein
LDLRPAPAASGAQEDDLEDETTENRPAAPSKSRRSYDVVGSSGGGAEGVIGHNNNILVKSDT